MKIVYSRRALAQLDEIFAYIAKDNPAAAASVVERIESCARRLGEYPYLGRVTEKEGVRVFVADPYPYLLFLLGVSTPGRGAYFERQTRRKTAVMKIQPAPAHRGGIGRPGRLCRQNRAQELGM